MHSETEPRDQQDIDVLLAQLDHPVPDVSVGDIVARAGRQTGRWRMAAAVLLSLVVAGGAYALPGSPLPQWIRAVKARLTGPAAAPAVVPSIVPEPQDGSGIAVDPGRTLVIRFTNAQETGTVRVSLFDGAQVMVRSSTGGATFNSDLDRLVIDNPGSDASFEIRIPRVANRVEIQVGGTRMFLKAGDRIEAGTLRPEDGAYLLPLRKGRSPL